MNMIVWVLVVGAGLEAPRVQPASPSNARIQTIYTAADARMAAQCDFWFEDGDYPKAVQLLRFRFDLHPHDYEIATDLGWMHENVEEPDRALQVYQAYRKKNPQDPDAALPEAEYCMRKKMYDRIPALLQPAIPRNPHPNVYRTLAHAYERLGKLKESEAVWVAYLKRYPDDGAAKNNLARVRNKLSGK
jgi:tetratricopeptide (TPR) repeat protein